MVARLNKGIAAHGFALRVFRDESAINVAWSVVTVVNIVLKFDALHN